MPTSNTTTVLSATNTWDPFAVACIHTTEFAVLLAERSETSRKRLLRNGWALNIWISAIPLTVCSSSAAIARSAFITRRIAACTPRPANLSVIRASGVSTSAATVICHEMANR